MHERCRRGSTVALICCLSVALIGSPILAGAGVPFAGKVLSEDGRSPRSGVVVALVAADSETSYRSQPTDTEGAFRVEGAPAGEYRVIAETAEGAYLAGQPVALRAGTNRPVALTLGGVAPNYQTGSGSSAGAGLPSWGKWIIVGGIVIAAALVVDEVTEDDEEDASPF